MKVLLVNPPFQRLKGVAFNYYSLGLGYVATVAARDGFDARVYDAELPAPGERMIAQSNETWFQSHQRYQEALKSDDHPIWQEIRGVLAEQKPDVVGMYVSTPVHTSACNVARLCKEYSDGCTVVWGGPHPSLLAEDVLTRESNVDFVVRSEGEITFRELLHHLTGEGPALPEIDGLSWRDNGRVVENKARAFVPKLDDLGYPDRDLLINEVDRSKVFRNIMGSRGCPYNCAYCASKKLWNRTTRFRTIPNVIEEIKLLRDRYGVKEIEFWDDSFTVKRKWTNELCDAMIAERLNVPWWCNTRADLIDEEIVLRMKRAGCTSIHIGVETGSNETLKYLNRKMTLEDIVKASEMLDRVKMNWFAYFMYGFPYEKVEDMLQSRDLMHKLSAGYFTLSIFNPYPGTELYDECKKLNLIPENPDWSRFSHQSPENCFNVNMSAEEFHTLVAKVVEECDQINSSTAKRLKRVLAKRSFYMRNPLAFLVLVRDALQRSSARKKSHKEAAR